MDESTQSTQSTTTETTTIGDARASLALADSSSAAPAAETPQTEPIAPAATTQAVEAPAAPDSASTEEAPKGEPPKWRWQDILANTRETVAKETADRVRQEVESQYGEFKGLSPEERTGLTVLHRAIRGDQQAIAHIAQVNPGLAQSLGYQPRAEPDPEPQPDAAIQLADGSTVPVFTPDGMKKREAWLQKQLATTLESQLTEKFKPLAQTAEQLRAHQEMVAQQQQTQQWAAQVLSPMQHWPFFSDFKPGIQKALAELPKDFAGSLEEVVATAYRTQLDAKVNASTKDATSKVLADIHQRAVAGTPNPAAASIATPVSTLGNARAALEAAEAQLKGAA